MTGTVRFTFPLNSTLYSVFGLTESGIEQKPVALIICIDSPRSLQSLGLLKMLERSSRAHRGKLIRSDATFWTGKVQA